MPDGMLVPRVILSEVERPEELNDELCVTTALSDKVSVEEAVVVVDAGRGVVDEVTVVDGGYGEALPVSIVRRSVTGNAVFSQGCSPESQSRHL